MARPDAPHAATEPADAWPPWPAPSSAGEACRVKPRGVYAARRKGREEFSHCDEVVLHEMQTNDGRTVCLIVKVAEHGVAHGDLADMTITPVMGTAPTHSVGLAEAGKPASSGPLLIISADNVSRLAASTPRRPIPETALVSIDWVHMESELPAAVQRKAGLQRPSAAELEVALAE